MSAKTLTIAGRQDIGVMETVGLMGVSLPEVADFIHGTTTALNALLERSGASLALVVTRGFRDVYEIGRASRPEMYNIHYRRPARLLRRRDIFEVDERTMADGTVRTPLDDGAVGDLAEALQGRYDAVAVCFLHSFRWPGHEQQAAEALRGALPGVSVVASHEVTAEWREYERWSTTLISAYVTPKIENYLGVLESRLREGGAVVPAPRDAVQRGCHDRPDRAAAGRPDPLLGAGGRGGGLRGDRTTDRGRPADMHRHGRDPPSTSRW